MASCVNTSVVIADSAATTTKTATGQTGANAQAVTTAHEANQFTSNLMRNVINNMANALAFAKSMSAVAGALVGGPDSAAAVNVAAQMGANAAENNRLLHKNEPVLAKDLASGSAGKYTQAQIEDAMRNANNSTYAETIASGMVQKADSNTVIGDKGAMFTAGSSGTNTIVQVLPNAGNVDPGLAAYIQANTGGASSPYNWTDAQVGKVTTLTVDPNASIEMKVDQNWSYMGTNAAGMPSGVSTDNRTQTQIDKSLNDITKAVAILPVAVGAAALTLEAALIGGGVNTAAQILKGDGVSPTEVLVSTTLGPIGAAATEVQAVKAIVEQGGKAAISTNAGIGAATNVVGDTTTKVLTGQEVTVKDAVTTLGVGAIGANVLSGSKVIPAIATEGLNAVIPIIEKNTLDKKGK